ncbi:MAG: ATP-binding protein, partial [Thermodesulfovibrionales bacterium]
FISSKNLMKRRLCCFFDSFYRQITDKSLLLEDVCINGLDTLFRLKYLSIEKKGAIFLKEKMDGIDVLKLAFNRGFSEDFVRLEAIVPCGDCLCGLCAIQEEVIISESALNDKRHTRNYPSMFEHGHIVLPLKAGDNLIGVLCLYLPPKTKPPEDEIGLLISLSNVLSVAIQNAMNFKRIEQLMKEIENHQERLRAMINTLPDCIKVIDREGRLIDINPAGLHIIKASSPEEVLGRSIIPMIEPEHREELERTIQRVFNQRTTEYLHLKIRDLRGEVHYIEGRYMPLRNPAGETIGILSISRDITEYKRLESQLYHSQKMEAIGQLAGGIAHDFNNMLNAIIGFGSLIDIGIKEDHPHKSYIREILKAAERATHLTRGLLTFSRRQPVRFETLELNELIKGFEKILKRIIGEDIKLKTILSEKPIIIMADPGQIEQVLMNLATNARDAMPEGGSIEITTSTLQIDEDFIKKHGYGKPGSYALIRFSDTGIGMDEITLSKIFEPYFTTKPLGRGTGLGLAIVYGIVKQHNGYINVESSPGKGTIFNIYLPLTKKQKDEIQTEVKEMPSGKGEIILVAEDSDEVMKALKEILTRFGYRIIEAKDGREAVEKFSSYKDDVSLLLFDVMMPEINGIDAWEEIKKIRDNVKVLFMSGYTDDILTRKGLSQEKINLISKPLSPEELLKRVRDILDAH